MTYFNRILDLRQEAGKRSVFLFGPRQTGKTSLIKRLFPEAVRYDLLRADVFLRITQRPQLIREELTGRRISPAEGPVIIDEIQKLPILLDEVHYLMEEHGFLFILTGSSARKLKRGAANLLGGRARTRHLFPLVSAEIPGFDLLRAVRWGSLPSIYLSDEPEEDLLAYCGSYLQEEIKGEGIVRRIENFSRFLQTAALVNGELLNFESLSSDCAVPARTLREYFFILEETLVGNLLPPYKRMLHRKAVSTAKFYFFDVGVANALAGRRDLSPRTELFGRVLEHLIFTELRSYLAYSWDRRPLTFWRDHAGHEIDFIIGDEIAIEVKAAETVSEKHLKTLRLEEVEKAFRSRIVVSLDSVPRTVDKVEILPCTEFLQRLWGGEYAA
jgi:predicted AAA+ superfamily ATPase